MHPPPLIIKWLTLITPSCCMLYSPPPYQIEVLTFITTSCCRPYSPPPHHQMEMLTFITTSCCRLYSPPHHQMEMLTFITTSCCRLYSPPPPHQQWKCYKRWLLHLGAGSIAPPPLSNGSVINGEYSISVQAVKRRWLRWSSMVYGWTQSATSWSSIAGRKRSSKAISRSSKWSNVGSEPVYSSISISQKPIAAVLYSEKKKVIKPIPLRVVYGSVRCPTYDIYYLFIYWGWKIGVNFGVNISTGCKYFNRV